MSASKRCPFCGGKAFLQKSPHDAIDTEFYYVCASCAAQGPWFKNKHGALRGWNTRVQEPRP